MKLDTKGIAALFKVSKPQVSRWKKLGMPKPDECGFYDLAAVLVWLHFRDRHGRTTDIEQTMQSEIADAAEMSPALCYFRGVVFALQLAERIFHRELYPAGALPCRGPDFELPAFELPEMDFELPDFTMPDAD